MNSHCAGFDASSAPASPSAPPARPDSRRIIDAQAQKEQRKFREKREEEERRREAERHERFTADRERLLGELRGTSRGLPGTGPGVAQAEATAPEQIAAQEQTKFDKNRAACVKEQKDLIRQRLKTPNATARTVARSLMSAVPPLPEFYKRVDALQPGDVLLVGDGLGWVDRLVSGQEMASAAHTVLYLKTVKGTRLFLDTQPGEGPRIVPEQYVRNRYGHRSLEVAKLAQPLNDAEAARLYAAARKLRVENLARLEQKHWFDTSGYGVWGDGNLVCSEADWSLINAAGRQIPATGNPIKRGYDIDFSPADFYGKSQYFLVSPMAWRPPTAGSAISTTVCSNQSPLTPWNGELPGS